MLHRTRSARWEALQLVDDQGLHSGPRWTCAARRAAHRPFDWMAIDTLAQAVSAAKES